MDAEVKLLPCPFCGVVPGQIELNGVGRPWLIIECNNADCRVGGIRVEEETRESAAEAWNKRDEVKLLPCPFCGEVPGQPRPDSFGETSWTVECKNGDCCMISRARTLSREETAAAWNKRDGVTDA